MRHLIIGGVRSGKSDFAEKLLANCLIINTQRNRAFYIATSLSIGEETKSRIARHQLHRNKNIVTCELDYQEKTLNYYLDNHDSTEKFILIECLSTWVGWYLSQDKPLKECINEYEHVKNQFIEKLNHLQATTFIVTGEVGCGLIGETKLMRIYADKLGELNQEIARISNKVTLVTAGIAQQIKG
jgi:adenosylcobinamide kinase/adenosylcobinamide-phosphate guanylyltransferase